MEFHLIVNKNESKWPERHIKGSQILELANKLVPKLGGAGFKASAKRRNTPLRTRPMGSRFKTNPATKA